MRAQRLQVGGEYAVVAEHAFHAHRGGDIRSLEQQAQIGDGHAQHTEHAVGAVDQRRSSFSFKSMTGRDAGRIAALRRRRSWEPSALRASPSPIATKHGLRASPSPEHPRSHVREATGADAGVQRIWLNLRGFRRTPVRQNAASCSGASTSRPRTTISAPLIRRSGSASESRLSAIPSCSWGWVGERAESGGDTVMRRHVVVGQMSITARLGAVSLADSSIAAGTPPALTSSIFRRSAYSGVCSAMLIPFHIYVRIRICDICGTCASPRIRDCPHSLTAHLPINSRRRKRDQSLPE